MSSPWSAIFKIVADCCFFCTLWKSNQLYLRAEGVGGSCLKYSRVLQNYQIWAFNSFSARKLQNTDDYIFRKLTKESCKSHYKSDRYKGFPYFNHFLNLGFRQLLSALTIFSNKVFPHVQKYWSSQGMNYMRVKFLPCRSPERLSTSSPTAYEEWPKKMSDSSTFSVYTGASLHCVVGSPPNLAGSDL